MEAFSIIWVQVPLVSSLFLASPWVLYQIWAFIAPGLYQKEKKMAVPFVLSTAGLFILGGCFAYFVAFRFGLAFLLGIGLQNGVTPLVTITHYFDLFVNVMLGVALVFELPVAIFFLTLLHLASPRFLLQHSRYAILAIVIAAAIITPTPDFFNLMLFAVPMCLLYFVGVFASYLLVMKREGKVFPWTQGSADHRGFDYRATRDLLLRVAEATLSSGRPLAVHDQIRPGIDHGACARPPTRQ